MTNLLFKTRLQKYFDYFFVDHTHVVLSLLAIAFAGAVVYRNAFSVPFLFDDINQIVFNPAIQTLEWPWRFLENTRRPVLYTSLALDFHRFKLETFGYHAFNVRVHMLAAMSLFLLIYKTCRLPSMEKLFRRDATWVALCASLLWLCHPLQTPAVTYIIQRAESLMGLFFILALYFSAQYLTSRKIIWLAGAGLTCLLCGLTKEVALALPLTVLLYDRAFISKSWSAIWKNNRALYLTLSVTWGVMLVLFFTTPPEKIPTAGFAIKDLSVWEYALNQPKVILHYLRLAIWPDPLIFDYHWPAGKNLEGLLPALALVVAGLTVLVMDYRRYPTACFLGLSFLVILAPSSSFIPLKDIINEYRMYLPLSCAAIGFTLLLKMAVTRKKFFLISVGILILVLGGITNQRNIVFQNEERLWRDVLKKQPTNVRTWSNLGSYLFAVDRYQEAENCFLNALALNPDSAEINANVAAALLAQKKFNEAVPYARRAIAIAPDFTAGHYNLAVALANSGHPKEAATILKKLKLK